MAVWLFGYLVIPLLFDILSLQALMSIIVFQTVLIVCSMYFSKTNVRIETTSIYVYIGLETLSIVYLQEKIFYFNCKLQYCIMDCRFYCIIYVVYAEREFRNALGAQIMDYCAYFGGICHFPSFCQRISRIGLCSATHNQIDVSYFILRNLTTLFRWEKNEVKVVNSMTSVQLMIIWKCEWKQSIY